MTIMYRVDKVPRCDLRNEYTVPCGMNSIVHISDARPLVTRVIQQHGHHVNKHTSLIFSKYDLAKRDFVIYHVEELAPF